MIGSVLFLALRPEGQFTAPRNDSSTEAPKALTIKILTWNVLRGADEGHLGAGWDKRKHAFSSLLSDCEYDIVCLQEVLPGQLEFFSTLLTDYQYVAVGRQDGRSKGEHGPIFYKTSRFELLQSETFWLSDTPDTPSKGWGEVVPRICTWIELKDIASRTRFRIYNTHLQLYPYAQYRAAELLAERIQQADVPVILAGDLNAPPDWPPLRILEDAGLSDAETSGALTWHVSGKAIRCLDHILHSPGWHVTNGGLLKDNPDNIYPSDHFGLWVELNLEAAPSDIN